MRLIDVNSFDEYTGEPQMKEFIGSPDDPVKKFNNRSNFPDYAILSHTWGDDEVLFSDIMNRTARKRKAFPKLLNTILKTKAERLDWVWIDTCCIDKSSSAELQEAINSMYKWYERSEVCIAYLEDVEAIPSVYFYDTDFCASWDDEHRASWEQQFCASRWFTRGWTLQELLAPREVRYFSNEWQEIFPIHRYEAYDRKHEDMRLLSQASGIDEAYVSRRRRIQAASVATRMSWAAGRQTTREEDEAYSLLGIFGVNMPLLYGEGNNAFIRLQEEIIRRSDDMSIFYWKFDTFHHRSTDLSGLLAPGPQCFSASSNAIVAPSKGHSLSAPFEMTNRGLKVEMPLVQVGQNLYFSLLDCFDLDAPVRCINRDPKYNTVGILLARTYEGSSQFLRAFPNSIVSISDVQGPLKGLRKNVFVPQTPNEPVEDEPLTYSIESLLLSSIEVYGGPQIRRNWDLLGLWQRNSSSGTWQDRWIRSSFYGAHSGIAWGDERYSSGLGGWEVSTPRELSVQERSQAVAVVLEHQKSSLRVAIVFSRAHRGDFQTSKCHTGLCIRAFTLPHQQCGLIWKKFALEVGVIEYKASSGTRFRARPVWKSGHRIADLVRKEILLCYRLELRVPPIQDQVFENIPRAHHKKPLVNEEVAKLFEEALQKPTGETQYLLPLLGKSVVEFDLFDLHKTSSTIRKPIR